MDEYGFGAAARIGLRMFEQSSRRSGRTMRLIERVEDGDRIVTTTEREARRLLALLREVGKTKVSVVCCDPANGNIARLLDFRGNRTFFDHLWQHAHYESRLNEADEALERIQRATSQSWPEKPVFDSGGIARIADCKTTF